MHRGAIVEPQWKAQARSVHWESDHAVCARIEGALDCLCVIRGCVAPRAPVNHGATVFQEQHHLSEALCKNACPSVRGEVYLTLPHLVLPSWCRSARPRAPGGAAGGCAVAPATRREAKPQPLAEGQLAGHRPSGRARQLASRAVSVIAGECGLGEWGGGDQRGFGRDARCCCAQGLSTRHSCCNFPE